MQLSCLGETMRRIATAFILALVACATFAGTASAQETLTFRIRSNYDFKVQIAFFSSNRVWPGVGRAWNLDDYKVHEYTLNCRSGEKICYGAWVTGNANKYWGVGSRNERYCKTCCYVCGDSDMTPIINLDDG